MLRRDELWGSGGVGGRESRGMGGVDGRGGVGGEACSDSCSGDSCWLGEADEVREVVELLGSLRLVLLLLGSSIDGPLVDGLREVRDH